MKTDDELLALCIAELRKVDPAVTVVPTYRADDPKLIASIRVTFAPGATNETRKEAKAAVYRSAQARWGISISGENLPS